ncbi:MAG: sensor histidine kinase [Spirochaetota bacterium]
MKLRTKLIFFVVGVVIVPLLVSGLIGYYFHIRREWVPSPRNIEQILKEFERVIYSLGGEVNLKRPDFSTINLPKGLSVWVLNHDGSVIYTNVEGSPGDEKFDVTGIGRGLLLMHPVTIEGTKNIRVMLQFPPGPESPKKKGPLFIQYIERTIWWLFALIVFSSFMITVIVRSFNRSVANLDRATQRIAEGDLDFELSAEGNDEIASLTRSFDTMRKKLKEYIARRSRFLMGVSHDLKTPLTSIKGYVEAISDGLADDPKKLGHYLSVIEEKTKTLEDRISKLIDYMRMETGDWRMSWERINLSEFLRHISEVYREDALVFRRNFQSDLKLPESLYVEGDRALVLHCFENLFDNAIRYTGDGDTVKLRATVNGEEAIVVLEDTGMGIEKDELDKVFEPFYRGSRSRREQGSGLGLSIVKSIIDAHGWKIEIESTPGKSTKVLIYMSTVDTK